MSKKSQEIDPAEMTLGSHLDELRKRLVRSVIALFVVAIVAFIYKGFVLDIIFGPMQADFFTNAMLCKFASFTGIDVLCINQNHVEIINTKIAGQFNLHIKSSIICGIVVAIPYIIWQLWLFVKPALDIEIQKECRRIVFEVSVWFFAGLLFGYYIISPLAVNFLTNYDVSNNITNMIEVSSYLSSVLGVSIASALVFQLPILVRLLAMLGILNGDMMRKYRRFAIAGTVILAAIITPPDVFSQILVSIPLYSLYEYGIIITDRINAKRAKKQLEMQEE